MPTALIDVTADRPDRWGRDRTAGQWVVSGFGRENPGAAENLLTAEGKPPGRWLDASFRYEKLPDGGATDERSTRVDACSSAAWIGPIRAKDKTANIAANRRSTVQS